MLKVKKIYIVVLILMIAVGCGESEFTTPQPEIKVVATNPPTSTAPPPTSTPAPTSLGSGDEGVYTETVASAGVLRTYTHYPTEHILYDEIRVDDRLDNVEYICQDQRHNITKSFRLQSTSGEIPAIYTSWQINMRPFCYIAFTVENVTGETMGIEIKSHCILCND